MARLRTLAVPVAGGIALVVGFVVLLWPRPASFGWFAYAPLAAQTYLPSFPDHTLAIGLLFLGVALLAGWIGFRLGRRPR